MEEYLKVREEYCPDHVQITDFVYTTVEKVPDPTKQIYWEKQTFGGQEKLEKSDILQKGHMLRSEELFVR